MTQKTGQTPRALTKDQILDGIAELTVIELKELLDAF
ncbi:MAG: hypothetical protein ACKOPB_01560, partial [Actinomycetota bacterium]